MTGSERNATLSGPTGERQAAVLEFFTVGGDRTAFLSGPVKGGGRRGRRGRYCSILLSSYVGAPGEGASFHFSEGFFSITVAGNGVPEPGRQLIVTNL